MVREATTLPNTRDADRDRLTLVADFSPAGDQPAAIDGLVVRLEADSMLIANNDSPSQFQAAS